MEERIMLKTGIEELNSLIVIYGKSGSYKSSLGISLLNNSDKNCCLVTADSHNHINIKDNVKVIDYNDEVNDEIVIQCVKEYDITLIDYKEAFKITNEELIKLKEIAKNNNNTLIVISCCSSKNDLTNNNHYEELKEIADLMIITDK